MALLLVAFTVRLTLAFVKAKRAFTNDGLELRTLPGGEDKWRILVYLTPDRPLPQPLEIRLQCSHELTEAFAVFYRDSDRPSGGRVAELKAVLRGEEAYFKFNEPRLKPPAFLAVVLCGPQESELSVSRFGWRSLE
jgi:hypothetical protein